MHFVIPGDPIPLARARVGYGARRVYDSQKELKLHAGIFIQSQLDSSPPLQGPLHLDIIFYMRMPKHFKKDKKILTYHSVRPDLSNLIKFYEDICNKIIFQDDAQIASICSSKIYHEDPRTEFFIKPLDIHEKYPQI